jgi:hypothetical protein
MEFADCTRVYKDHTHSVSTLIEHDGLVFTACGDTFARCFDGKSGALKRTFKGHKGAINCLRVIIILNFIYYISFIYLLFQIRLLIIDYLLVHLMAHFVYGMRLN